VRLNSPVESLKIGNLSTQLESEIDGTMELSN